jgi:hypothetical protein
MSTITTAKPRRGDSAEGSICLFSPALELIPKSFGEPGETVAKAIARLRPKLNPYWQHDCQMTLNAESSRLKLGVTMNLVGQEGQIIGQAFTPRGCEEPTSCPPLGSRGSEQQRTQQLPIGSSLQFRVSNGEQNPLYVGIVLIDPAEGLVVLFPNDYQTPQISSQRKPHALSQIKLCDSRP